jgi:dTDP-4-amino-4,6-dideoxygalactose transaminase
MAIANDDAMASALTRYAEAAPWPEDELVEALLRSVVVDQMRYKSSLRLVTAPWLELLQERAPPSTSAAEMARQRPAGYGCRLPAPLAALGLNQLRKLDDYNRQRRAAARRWADYCRAQGFTTPLVLPDSEPAPVRFPFRASAERKSNPAWAFPELGVHVGVWFKTQLHPAEGEVGDCPNAREAVRTCLNLPCLSR